jgi:hypothetical protein
VIEAIIPSQNHMALEREFLTKSTEWFNFRRKRRKISILDQDLIELLLILVIMMAMFTVKQVLFLILEPFANLQRYHKKESFDKRVILITITQLNNSGKFIIILNSNKDDQIPVDIDRNSFDNKHKWL